LNIFSPAETFGRHFQKTDLKVGRNYSRVLVHKAVKSVLVPLSSRGPVQTFRVQYRNFFPTEKIPNRWGRREDCEA
jgi:hypothetical protein